MADWESLAKKLEAVTVLETYENGSQLVQNAHPDGFLAAAVIREQAARIAELEAALSRLLNALNAGIIHPPEEYPEAKRQARAALLETKYD